MPQQLVPVPRIPQLAAVPTTTQQLAPGLTLEFLTEVPDDAAGRRLAVRASTLYAIVGHRRDTSEPYLGGYVGMSQALHSARADVSWTRWVVAQKAIQPTGMVLLHCEQPLGTDQLLVLESRVIQRLSADLASLALTNTQTSANVAAARLSSLALQATIRLADQIAEEIHRTALFGFQNPFPAPAANAREASVRIVLRASKLELRGLETTEVVERLEAAGHTTTGSTLWRSVRRDLSRREMETRCPRIRSLTHRYRVLYYGPDLSADDAIRGYDRVHPRRQA